MRMSGDAQSRPIVGPVLVAADEPAILHAIEAVGGRAILTRADHASGSDRIFEALNAFDAAERFDIVVNVQGDLPTIEASAVRAVAGPLDEPQVDIATLATPIVRPEERDGPECGQGGRRGNRAEASAGALFHARQRALGRGSAAASYRPLRLSSRRRSPASSLCRRPRWSGARSSNSCARWRLE